ncbi:MAG TPA: PQQ-binding-like beta-propeller repeat protein [Pyrinomonadaceae bacterium]|nr:PQQ-binding-like beta-propeller repeat protein [Pyrinomonadaceae bacterium]
MVPSSALFLHLFAALLVLQTLSCSSGQSGTQPTPTPTPLKGPTGAQVTIPPDDGQWPMPAKDYASTRYSGLEEINAGNVQNLKVAWTFSVGVNRGQEAAPIVVGDTMYVATPYPNVLYALDLTKEKQGRRS